ncbi:MAG: cell division ATP-binding protein FtsE [Candidatus Zambryskibacteria bacterium RIFCSPHIGHO2_12_FULL_38_34]|uniref:Cell division ATP-binding protein FtsE n=1 Tax=Candidatus Zambryskibacteria bacterium RIFCSPLOWO2_12_FULL_39_16 TaxID=1802775 RepID=A0A1G2UTX1_9BACT|nr:MAG: cell division ATP-binding protein FtsE [Candidatus Zambryskibacteria bacterium RIFCSPHIGHO2_02_FULL_38_22]OHA97575.1 MAG: cell division ATP-binding protein FtsE [Candidatus Zambryskibacteria bacterium RIFCSPHIGHO2_12_FULL_38_34]OHB08160.1 MAG: cell division ATP-binding protein FtsE [Candidatus Zambryskibacteria bacterium RIFCSPLOWO2_02_FULL_38_13]OHB12853.1 MAG: cell division ATP-binding protein FtsE [Candidatus Zambryskibacteria bacterium RIFCSPLOWO2_12_FULL_39_16]
MIVFDNVSKKYNDNYVALDKVSFVVNPNEFVSIVGPSGAGKTTLLRMLLAEEKPTEGKVFLHDTDINTLSGEDINFVRRKIGAVFQDFRLLPQKNVYENIAFAMEAAGRPDEEIESDVPHVLELVDLASKIWNFPSTLSGGEKQRVAIARAIVNQPDIIIADEPTGNLDPINTYDIVQILKKINDLGTTVILTTHNKGVIDSIGRRVITMQEGKVVRDDPAGKYIL